MREEWRAEYLAANEEALRLANEEALRLATDALQYSGWEPSGLQELLATLAALHGHTDLAMHLFLQGGVTELSCPFCGEAIAFGEAE